MANKKQEGGPEVPTKRRRPGKVQLWEDYYHPRVPPAGHAKPPMKGFKIPKVPQYRVPGNKNSWTWISPPKKAVHKR